jgi:hypothetical protein
MPKILVVHGISNQYAGENELHAAWYPALCDGLERAHSPLGPEPHDCLCPFYGDIFRPSGSLGIDLVPDVEDVTNANERETALVTAIWQSAVDADCDIPNPSSYGETLFRAPRLAERALGALAKSKYLADYLPLRFFGDLRQVDLYLNNFDVHRAVLERVCTQIDPETKIVIGHSLGSVVAYEAICLKPERINTLITLGSPLGIKNVVFDKLTPAPDGFGLGHWPGVVKHWTNIAALGDIVAAQKRLAPLFGDTIEDVIIDSGWDAHSSTRYLNSVEAGRTVARALAD